MIQSSSGLAVQPPGERPESRPGWPAHRWPRRCNWLACAPLVAMLRHQDKTQDITRAPAAKPRSSPLRPASDPPAPGARFRSGYPRQDRVAADRTAAQTTACFSVSRPTARTVRRRTRQHRPACRRRRPPARRSWSTSPASISTTNIRALMLSNCHSTRASAASSGAASQPGSSGRESCSSALNPSGISRSITAWTSPACPISRVRPGRSKRRYRVGTSARRRRINCSSEGQSMPGIRRREQNHGAAGSTTGRSRLWHHRPAPANCRYQNNGRCHRPRSSVPIHGTSIFSLAGLRWRGTGGVHTASRRPRPLVCPTVRTGSSPTHPP